MEHYENELLSALCKKNKLTNEEKALIKIIEELPADKKGEIIMMTIAKKFSEERGRKHTSKKIGKMLDEVGKKILINLDCGFARRIRHCEGVSLCVSVRGLEEAKKLMEDKGANLP